MYVQDGKPVVPPMGRRNPDVSRLEFDKLLQRFEQLEAIVLTKNEDKKEPAETAEDIEALKAEAIELGIEVKGNWGAKRIKQAIEDAKAEK